MFENKEPNKNNCNHKYVFYTIRDLYTDRLKELLTCMKCGFTPPEGYIPNEKTKRKIERIKNRRQKEKKENKNRKI